MDKNFLFAPLRIGDEKPGVAPFKKPFFKEQGQPVEGVDARPGPAGKGFVFFPLPEPLPMAPFPGPIDVLAGGFFKTLDHIKGLPLNDLFHLPVKLEQ